MKIAVFSDSHGNLSNMARALTEVSPDMAVHLGDYCRDAHELIEDYPAIQFKIVRGNCDMAAFDRDSDLFICSGIKTLITHGHRYNVKRGLDELYAAGRSAGAGLLLFGHTHIPRYEEISLPGGAVMRALNPGSAGCGARPGWALLEIKDTDISCRLIEF